MNNKRNTIIGVLLLLVIMTIGYALFSETVTIGGTAKADGNLSLDFYNSDGTDGLDIKVKGVGSSGTAKIDESRKTLTVTANFDYPTAYVEIPVKVKNTGNINLSISDFNISGTITVDNGNGLEKQDFSSWQKSWPELLIYEGIKKHDLIKINDEKNIIIKTKFIESNWSNVEKRIKSFNFNLSINCLQELNDNDTGLPIPPYIYAIGDEISIGNEKFNVISEDVYTVTMLAKNVLDRNAIIQTTSSDWKNVYSMPFSDEKTHMSGYWTDDNGQLSLEYGSKYPVYVYNNKSKVYNLVESYIKKLKGIKNISDNDESSIIGKLIAEEEYRALNIPENQHWLFNRQYWWTGTSCGGNHMYSINGPDGAVHNNYYWYDTRSGSGVRPVITIDKKYLK